MATHAEGDEPSPGHCSSSRSTGSAAARTCCSATPCRPNAFRTCAKPIVNALDKLNSMGAHGDFLSAHIAFVCAKYPATALTVMLLIVSVLPAIFAIQSDVIFGGVRDASVDWLVAEDGAVELYDAYNDAVRQTGASALEHTSERGGSRSRNTARRVNDRGLSWYLVFRDTECHTFCDADTIF